MSNPAPAPSASTEIYGVDEDYYDEESKAVISWSAIIGGTFTAIALSMILVGFGSGLGFASLSFWHQDVSAKHLTWMAAAWLILTQWISSGLGGYLTGGLRTKWSGVHTHEVFFRDTAHGFITWAVTTVITTLIVVLIAASAVHAPMHARYENTEGPAAYTIDKLFRTDHAPTDTNDGTKAEATPIIHKAMMEKNLSESDHSYLVQLVASHTGLDNAQAQTRVDETLTQMHAARQQMEKTTASISILTFLSMLIGAFVACVAAALGGHERDIPHPQTL